MKTKNENLATGGLGTLCVIWSRDFRRRTAARAFTVLKQFTGTTPEQLLSFFSMQLAAPSAIEYAFHFLIREGLEANSSQDKTQPVFGKLLVLQVFKGGYCCLYSTDYALDTALYQDTEAAWLLPDIVDFDVVLELLQFP